MERRSSRPHFLSILGLVTLLAGAPAAAETFYVAESGSDANSGGLVAPFRTPEKAAAVVKPGDVVVVRNGTYRASSTASNRVFTIRRAGLPDRWITFKAENVGRAVIDGGGTTPYGIVIEKDVAYVRIEGFDVRNAANGGIWANTNPGSRHVAIVGNRIRYNGNGQTACSDLYGRAGIFLNPHTSNFRIAQNLIHDNGRKANPACDSLPYADNHNYRHDHGIYAQGRFHRFENNVIHSHPSGYHVKIDGFYGAIDYAREFSHAIVNNTFGPNVNPDRRSCGTVMMYNNRTASDLFGVMRDPRALIQNNIFLDPKGASTMYDTAVCLGPLPNSSGYGGHVITRNITASGSVYNEEKSWVIPLRIDASGNLVKTDPMLADPSRFDFALRPGSPAVDKGLPAGAPAFDYRNARRDPRPDIGAQELSVVRSLGTPPPAKAGAPRPRRGTPPSVGKIRAKAYFRASHSDVLVRLRGAEVTDRDGDLRSVQLVSADWRQSIELFGRGRSGRGRFHVPAPGGVSPRTLELRVVASDGAGNVTQALVRVAVVRHVSES